jgi:hypothetical protein
VIRDVIAEAGVLRILVETVVLVLVLGALLALTIVAWGAGL